jgi:Transposase DDE domain group 1
LRDLAVMLADGGDCLSDLAVLRDQPELFGPVASTPTAWRVVERVATDPDGLARLRAARAHARARAWAAGAHPDLELLVVDADATLVLAHSDAKQGAAGTYKHSFGFHPLLAYLDRGAASGEPLAGLLRPSNAPAGGSQDLIELVDLALTQLPATDRPVLVRSDSAGASTRLVWHLRDQGVGFSVGMPIDAHVREAVLAQPEAAWTPAVDADGQLREGAEVCELTGWIDLHTWPPGTRAICRREDAHPGAQLRFSDHDGHRFQVFVTDQPDGDLARLELRHRQRARVEDRIRAAKATGLANLPFDRWRRNSVWLELVLAAQDLTVWTQALLLDGALAIAEPKTLRYRLLHVAARVVRHARRMILRLQRSWPWAAALAQAFTRLRALPLRC